MSPPPDKAQVTRLLESCRAGESAALEQLMPLVYDELRGLASRQLSRERIDHTLQATALVNEAFLKLVDQRNQSWENRGHFMCLAAMAMRRILVNHALAKKAAKRGGGRARVTLDEGSALFEERAEDLLALDTALTKLALIDDTKRQLVELRFFAGLTAEEAAAAMGVSTRTVERQWRLARAWLRREIEGAEAEPDDES